MVAFEAHPDSISVSCEKVTEGICDICEKSPKGASMVVCDVSGMICVITFPEGGEVVTCELSGFMDDEFTGTSNVPHSDTSED